MKRKFVDSDIDPVKYFFPSIGEIIDSYLEKKGYVIKTVKERLE